MSGAGEARRTAWMLLIIASSIVTIEAENVLCVGEKMRSSSANSTVVVHTPFLRGVVSTSRSFSDVPTVNERGQGGELSRASGRGA